MTEIDDVSDLSIQLDRATWRLGLIYWSAMFVADTILSYLIAVDPITSAPARFIIIITGAMMAYIMNRLLLRLRQISLTRKALLCFLMTAVAAPMFTLLDYLYAIFCQYPMQVPLFSLYFGYTLLENASMLFGWSCLFVALLYSFEVRAQERRLAAVREEALSAQMRALRYQVNPHFLFNTLNSIAGLIEEGAARPAERMVLSLSTFLRTTLALDPMHDVPLVDELALQEEYLEIERERFSDRMIFRIDVPDELHDALVPSLILQPLVENAIKHGLGPTVGKVEIVLSARRIGNRIQISVENDMPVRSDDRCPSGMGVGQRNVAERLRSRFGDDAGLTAGPNAPGRYNALIDLPWKTA